MVKLVAAIPLAVVALLTGMSYVVVDVSHPLGHVVFPVPLAAAQAALTLAPPEGRHIRCREFARHRDAALRLVDELRRTGDGTLVEVDDGHQRVLVSKREDALEVEVLGSEERVLVSLPLGTVSEIIASYADGAFETKSLVAALGNVSDQQLVHVRTEDEEIEIWIW